MQKHQEQQWAAAFHLLDAEERQFWLESLQLYTAGRESKTPQLKLIVGSPE